MRFATVLVAALLFGGCGAAGRGGASWPKPTASSAPTDDGGESLAPRSAHAGAAAIEADEDLHAAPAPAPPAPVVSAPAPASVAPPPPAPTAATDDPMTTEDIVIEVDD